MNSFRDRIIHWVEKHHVKARRLGAVVRHEALIENKFHLIVQYDRLNPAADALVWLRVIALPYEKARRKAALSAMFSLNHTMIGQENFGLTLSDDGEYISLICRARAAEMSEAEFHRMMARFFGWARRSHQKLAAGQQKTASPSDMNADLSVRYL